MKKSWIVYILLIPISFGFYYQNSQNYELFGKIKHDRIDHPEKLPTSESAIIGSFGNRKLLADMYWLQTIQYIGSNVINGEYKRYLFVMMNLITDVDPYFIDPYVIGQLLLPGTNERYEDFTPEEVQNNIREAEILGLKGIQSFCDVEKVEAIMQENNLNEILTNDAYTDPCKEYKIPYYLAYIYHFYLDDSLTSAQYYKIVSAQSDAPSGAKVLAAIMQGKGGEREKSTHMFLSLAQSLSSENDACNYVSGILQENYQYISSQNKPITGELVENIQNVLGEIHPKITDENEFELTDDTSCISYLAKAVREINLLYLERADEKYVADNPGETSAYTPEKLLKLGYISFNPTDFQQYEGKSYGIVYRYSEKSGGFDYEMGEINN